MNNINIIGRIGKEIELKYLQSGNAVASFSIAVDQSYVKDGQKVEKTSWFDISCFGKTAENVNKFFRKGSRIGISGELEQQQWKSQDGENRSRVIIKMQNFTFIDSKGDNQGGGNNNYQAPQGNQQQQQQSYQAPAQQQHQGYGNPNKQAQQQMPSSNSVPVIDIDEENIPF